MVGDSAGKDARACVQHIMHKRLRGWVKGVRARVPGGRMHAYPSRGHLQESCRSTLDVKTCSFLGD